MADPRTRSDQRNALIRVDSPDIRRLVDQLSRARRQIKPGVKGAQVNTANRVARKAKQLAHWSRRIPKTIKVIGKGNIVQVIAGGPTAPHAPVFEAPAGRPVRHPVYARGKNRGDWTWVAQQPRPFIQPAVRMEGQPAADAELSKVADKTFGELR